MNDMDMLRVMNTLKRHEGAVIKKGRHVPYTCPAGHSTVGYGRNLDANGISDNEAEYMLWNDIYSVIKELHELLPWFDRLRKESPVRAEALVNMGFNMGVPTLMGFHRTLRELRQGHYDTAADAVLQSKYARQVGNRAVEVAHMIRTGEIL